MYFVWRRAYDNFARPSELFKANAEKAVVPVATGRSEKAMEKAGVTFADDVEADSFAI